jgi:hypothetical protein
VRGGNARRCPAPSWRADGVEGFIAVAYASFAASCGPGLARSLGLVVTSRALARAPAATMMARRRHVLAPWSGRCCSEPGRPDDTRAAPPTLVCDGRPACGSLASGRVASGGSEFAAGPEVIRLR